MHVEDRMIYILLALCSLTLVGMLIGSWRLILYPYLIIIGLMILIGLWSPIKTQTEKLKYIPYSVSIIYLIVFITLDIITRNSLLGGESYIFGLAPSMALYMFVIFPGGTIVCLLYALTFRDDLMNSRKEE